MLKKLILASLVALVCASGAMALDDITPPAGGGFYDGTINETGRTSLSNSLIVAMTAQSDSATTTVWAAYTPRRKGDLLVGRAGLNTNAVWIAKGTTTNDWVQLTP